MSTHRTRRPGPMRAFAAMVAALLALGLFAGWTATAGAAGGDALQIRQVDTTDPARSRPSSSCTPGALTTSGRPRSPTAATASTASGPSCSPRRPRSASPWSSTRRARWTTPAPWCRPSRRPGAGSSRGPPTSRPTSWSASTPPAPSRTQVQSLTTDTNRILAAIDRVGPPGDAGENEKSAMWAAIQLAGRRPRRQGRLPGQRRGDDGHRREHRRVPLRGQRRGRQRRGEPVRRRADGLGLQRRLARLAW